MKLTKLLTIFLENEGRAPLSYAEVAHELETLAKSPPWFWARCMFRDL
jgi:hypothetical protein